jgi:hypothetical protein
MAIAPNLADVAIRLERAKEHIETVRSRTKAFLERDPEPFDFRTEKASLENGAEEYVLYAVIPRGTASQSRSAGRGRHPEHQECSRLLGL